MPKAQITVLHQIVLILVLSFVVTAPVAAQVASVGSTVRLKDLAKVEGVRDNQLIGYGLVVGLPMTGDRLQNTPFTERIISAML
jgi:flagellar P-ring protein precursor FlgI